MPRVARLPDDTTVDWKFVDPSYHSERYFEVYTDLETIKQARDYGIGGDGSMLIREVKQI
ncbi:hypothetical protein LCGC14_2938060 [marine sediment metagenome]|uniref:Uncharacterized protein n=1 Tax=marine sediment metagenome TaxID=412755 RepID=A0A0F9A9V6_9ZZZZ